MAIIINDNSARVQYTATASQTVFTVPYEFFANADLKVYQNSTLKTITTHYTVTGAGLTGGGTVTFVTGATLNDIITIVRDIAVARVTDFPTSGPFVVDDLNTDLDRLTAMTQQQETKLARTLRLDDFDTPNTFNVLPVKATRASKLLSFDANGNPEATLSAGDISSAQSYATAAAASATASAASATAAAASFDAFDDIYLGAYSTNPTLDNDGNALTTGDQYFNTTANELRIWNGSSWQAASIIGGTISTLNVTGVASFADGSAALPSITNDGDTNTGMFFPAADTIAFAKGGAEAMRIDSSGNVGIGTTSLTVTALRVSKSITGSSASQGIRVDGAVQTDVTNNASYFQAVPSMASGTLSILNSFEASQGTIGATVTSQVGFRSRESLLSATNNYGFFANDTAAVTAGKTAYGYYSAVNTATGGGTTYGFYAAGTAINYFGAKVGIGTLAPDGSLEVAGTSPSQYLTKYSTDTSAPQFVIRKSRGTEASKTVVVSGDNIGQISFHAYDGSNFSLAASILAEVDGTPGANDMPGRLLFRVSPNGSASVVTQATINENGLFSFNSGYGSVATAYGCRAWVNFNGTGTVAIRASGNVSSITDGGTGLYTVNFTTSVPDVNYAVTSLNRSPGVTSGHATQVETYTTSSTSIITFNTTSTNYDPTQVSVAIFR
jgi:hypothetical protein